MKRGTISLFIRDVKTRTTRDHLPSIRVGKFEGSQHLTAVRQPGTSFLLVRIHSDATFLECHQALSLTQLLGIYPSNTKVDT